MTYEEFITELKNRVSAELGIPQDSMTFYPKGYTSDDPETIEWIRDSNMLYTGEDSDTLLDDFLLFELSWGSNKQLHRIAVRQMYEDSLEKGCDEVFGDISGLKAAAEANQSRLDDRSSYEKV